MLVLALGYFILDRMVGITEMIVRSMGRDMTFTGRTEVWNVLLNVGTDPLLGTGFMSFWDDIRFQSKLPYWISSSAHNGYLEIYLAGGVIGIFMLGLLLLVTGVVINRDLTRGENYSVVRFAIFVSMLIANFAESNFACMTPLGFVFILVAIGYARPAQPEYTFPEGTNSAEENSTDTESDTPLPVRTPAS